MNCDLLRSHGRLVYSLDLSLLFIVLVGRNFVSGICKLIPKNLKETINLKIIFC